jgi:hypothetical protein
LASINCAGVKDSTQENTNNITNPTNMMAVLRKMTSAFLEALAPCSFLSETENCEIAGEWLKANTSTGMVNQSQPRKFVVEGTTISASILQCGMRYNDMKARIAIRG